MPWPFKLDSNGNSPERDFIIQEAKRAWGYESPFPDIEQLKQTSRFDQIFSNLRINYEESRRLSSYFAQEFGEYWFPASNDSNTHYTKNPKFNLSFPEYDAFILDSMIRYFKPKKIIEFGSGQSTRVMAAATMASNVNADIVCVDRYAEIDVKNTLRQMKVIFHAIDIVEFDADYLLELKENDILFIDSSHVLKNFGDVEFIYLFLFPLIPKGVIVHIYDIFLPNNYPSQWIIDWRSVLTEQHLLGSWLDNRNDIQILAANFWNLNNGVPIPENIEYRLGGSFWFKVLNS